MAVIPTIRVVFKKFGHSAWINTMDFDPEVHELYVDPEVKAIAAVKAAEKAKEAAEAATVDVEPEIVEEPKRQILSTEELDRKKAEKAAQLAAAREKAKAAKAAKKAEAAKETDEQ